MSDSEKENDHENVVDKLLDSHVLGKTDGEGLIADCHGQACLQKLMIQVCCEGQVCEQHGNDDAYKQSDTASPRLTHEVNS